MYGLALGLMAGAGNSIGSAANSAGSSGNSGGSKKLDRMFERLDTNKDGQISQAEFMVSGQNLQPGSAESATGTPSDGAGSANSSSARRNLFKAMDTNGDGNISKEEASAFSAQKTAARAALLSIQEQFGSGQPTSSTGTRRQHHHANAVQPIQAVQASTSVTPATVTPPPATAV